MGGIMTRTAPLEVRRGNPPDASDRAAALTPRRRLQLALAGLWVLDGLLKLQPFMFTKSFAPMTLGDAADGAPGWLAGPIHWASGIEQDHPVGLMVLFALVELAIGFGIAWPRTLRPALIGCIVWVPFLWFFAEGLGGLASGSPSAFDGAPGASILYGLLAVLLWPTKSDHTSTESVAVAASGTSAAPGTSAPSSEAARFVGGTSAKAIWIALWGLLALLAFLPYNRDPGAFSDVIAGNGEGAPAGYVSVLNHATAWAAGRGGELGIVFGVALVLVALSVLAPRTGLVRAGMVLALVLSALIWVFGEGFAFWPLGRRPAAAVAPEASAPEGAAA